MRNDPIDWRVGGAMSDHPMWGLIEQLEKLRGQAVEPASESEVARHRAGGKAM